MWRAVERIGRGEGAPTVVADRELVALEPGHDAVEQRSRGGLAAAPAGGGQAGGPAPPGCDGHVWGAGVVWGPVKCFLDHGGELAGPFVACVECACAGAQRLIRQEPC